MAAIRLISVMLHNGKQVNDMRIVFLKYSDLDKRVLDPKVYLCYPKGCCCPPVENAKVS